VQHGCAEPRQLGAGELGGAAGAGAGTQRPGAALLPADVPAAGGLRGDPEAAGNLGLRDAPAKQPGGLAAALLQGLEVGEAAASQRVGSGSGGWVHAREPRTPATHHQIRRRSVVAVGCRGAVLNMWRKLFWLTRASWHCPSSTGAANCGSPARSCSLPSWTITRCWPGNNPTWKPIYFAAKF